MLASSSLRLFRPQILRLRCQTKPQPRSRIHATVVDAKLQLVPTGDGSTAHLGEAVPMPRTLELPESGSVELGRDEPADLLVQVPTVSGRHALLKVEGGDRVTVTDLNSTNGTFVDSKQLEPMVAQPLNVGSEVTFGDMFLAKFQLQEAPIEAGGEVIEAEVIETEKA